MKKCPWCGKEYADDAIVCEIDGFELRAPAAPAQPTIPVPPPSPARPAARQPFASAGAFCLRAPNSVRRSSYIVVSSSSGGLKVGTLRVSPSEIRFQQRLTGMGGFLVGLIAVVLVIFLLEFVSFFLSHTLMLPAPPAAVTTLIGLLLGLFLVILPGFLLARRFRRVQRVVPVANITAVSVGLRDIQIDYSASPSASGSDRATISTVSSGPSTGTEQLVFTPADPAALARFAAAFSAAGVAVDEEARRETAEFKQRLTEATPRAWVTPTLIALNAVVFLLMAASDSKSLFSPRMTELVKWGADFGPLTTIDGQWWRLLACCFVHIGLIHLACNMYALLQAGVFAERLFGSIFFLVIYLGCGLLASLASVSFNPTTVSAGASGAVFGIYGALLGYMARERAALPRSVVGPLAKSTILFVACNLFYGFQNYLAHAVDVSTQTVRDALPTKEPVHSGPMIDQAAHIGGLLAGLLLGFVAARPLLVDVRRAIAPRRSIALALSLLVMSALLFTQLPMSHQPNIASLETLGVMFLRGEGVETNVSRAVAYLRQAAQHGDTRAQFLLGAIFYQGEGMPKDVEGALTWFTESAEKGNVLAQKALAGLYLRGEGVPENADEAARWLRRAADVGDAEARAELAALRLPRVAEAFAELDTKQLNSLQTVLQTLDKLVTVSDVTNAAHLDWKLRSLDGADKTLGELRIFLLNPVAAYRELLVANQLDPVLAHAQVTALKTIETADKPYVLRMLDAADEDVRQARILLQEMRRHWGHWSGDPARREIQFTSTAARAAYESAAPQVERSHKTLGAEVKAWLNWRAAHKQQFSRSDR